MKRIKPTVIAGAFFVIVMAFTAGLLVAKLTETQSNSLASSPLYSIQGLDIDLLAEIVDAINEEYLGDAPTQDEITYGVIKGIVESLDDEYTYYLDPEETAEYYASANNEFEGVGITLGEEDDYVVVESVLEGHPAEAAGLHAGDYILSVDGVSVLGETAVKAASMIRGESGTAVSLAIYRPNDATSIDIEIVRAAIDLPNMYWEELEQGVAYVRILRFSEDSAQGFNDAWDQLVDEIVLSNPGGVVLDLRNNPGGYVDSALHVLEEFTTNGSNLLIEQYASGRELVSSDNRTGQLEDTPMVVLVNEGSASASEIFAAAIQDLDRGEIIGQATVGKGVEQKLVQFADDSLLVMVFRRWLSPVGNQIAPDAPVSPDVLVTIEEDGADSQLESALDVLNNQ